jgi:hypothetical protein
MQVLVVSVVDAVIGTPDVRDPSKIAYETRRIFSTKL